MEKAFSAPSVPMMSPVSSSTMVNCAPMVERRPISPAGKSAPEKYQAPALGAQEPVRRAALQGVAQARAEEALVVRQERSLVGRGGQMPLVDEGVGEVDGGRLHVAVEQLVRVA